MIADVLSEDEEEEEAKIKARAPQQLLMRSRFLREAVNEVLHSTEKSFSYKLRTDRSEYMANVRQMSLLSRSYRGHDSISRSP